MHLSRKRSRQPQMLLLLSQSLVTAHAIPQGNFSSLRPFLTWGGECSLTATALEGTLESQTEWPLQTLNPTKAQEVGDASFNSPVLPLPLLGSCPPSGRHGDAWCILGGSLGNDLSKENRQGKESSPHAINTIGQGGRRVCFSSHPL